VLRWPEVVRRPLGGLSVPHRIYTRGVASLTPEVADTARVSAFVDRIVANVARVVHAPQAMLRMCAIALVAEGHVIIEDAPGVGKTMLAKALARSVESRFSRLQFTPDLLPSDVTGVSVFNQRSNEFEFRPGPVFTDLLLVDEINRASPKTQAALLECMQERQVTVDGVTHRLTSPFMVIATQNPIEFEGTYPLPEAQLDRFMMLLHIGYPTSAQEEMMVSEQARTDAIDSIGPVATTEEVRLAIAAARAVYVDDALNAYAVAILRATRDDRRVALGASPRAGIALMRVAKARAIADGREFVEPEDIRATAQTVLGHRVIVAPEARTSGVTGAQVVQEAVERARLRA
jgi:MoxR-like ATPase